MRFLFTTFPAIGHLNTVLPLARAARRAGHEVAVASGADVAAEIARQGFTAWEVGPTRAEAAALRAAEPDRPSTGQPFETDLTAMFLPSAAKRAVDLVPRALQWRPDVVVHEISEVAGAVAAALTGARHVVHGLGITPTGPMWEALFAPGFAQLCAEWEVPALTRDVLEADYLDILPPSLRTEQPAWRRVRPIRPGIGRAAPGEQLPAALDALPHPETIHLTLGTVFFEARGVLEAAIAGLRDLPFNLVVTTGPGTDPAAFGPQPPHVLLAPYLPHSLLLPRCCLVVAHGGAGIMLGALEHGLPQLMLPQGAEQFLNAELCRRAGVALALGPAEVSADSVAAAARDLLGRYGYTRAAERVRAEIAAMPTPARVLDVLTGGR
ncbi:MAG: glycosyltransferase [Pseudonocardia sp.]